MYPDVSRTYLTCSIARFLGVTLDTYQDTSGYPAVLIHVFWTLHHDTSGYTETQNHDTCILDASSEPRWIHTRYALDTHKTHSGYPDTYPGLVALLSKECTNCSMARCSSRVPERVHLVAAPRLPHSSKSRSHISGDLARCSAKRSPLASSKCSQVVKTYSPLRIHVSRMSLWMHLRCMYLIMYLGCPVCILITPLRIHVSCMYPACISHVSCISDTYLSGYI